MDDKEKQEFAKWWNKSFDPPNLIVIPQEGVLEIEEEVEEPPRFLEGLAKLMKRKKPWEDNK